jgi:hypothetical protein
MEPLRPGAALDALAESQIEKLRERLLDLSNRNRLLKFKHPDRSRTQVRIVGEQPVALYRSLLDGASFRMQPVAEPQTDVGAPRPPVAEVARRQGIDPSYDLGEVSAPTRGNASTIQVLHYPQEAERRLEGMRQEHLTSLQELGVPALHGVFGFLEWYDRGAPTTPLLSPLVLVPLEIERARERGHARYKLTASSEEPEPNRSLGFRLQRDLGLALPGVDRLSESRDLGAYLSAVEAAIAGMPNWRVRRMVTFSTLSFARQVMYEDLAQERWLPRGGRAASTLVRTLVAGGDGALAPARYERRTPSPTLITEADSTQVAVIEDVRAGKSLVVKGPPGTGKSQTITNLIATAMADGKRVLFVAEKMAALDVVKKRLDEAGLAEFCLALHSTKAKKRDVMATLSRSRDAHVPRPPVDGLSERERELALLRSELDRYLAAMLAPIGALGLSARDVVWREQALRSELGSAPVELTQLAVPGALTIARADLESARRSLGDLGRALEGLGALPASHPWRFVSSWDVHRQQVDVTAAAVAGWERSLRALTASFQDMQWSVDGMAVGDIAYLADQLGDLAHVGPAAPSELVSALQPPAEWSAVDSLCLDLESRAMEVSQVQHICDVRQAIAQRDRLDALLAAVNEVPSADLPQRFGELASRLGSWRLRADALFRAVEHGRQLVEGTRLAVRWDARDQRMFVRIGELAGRATPAILQARSAGSVDPGAGPVIASSAEEAESLRQRGAALDEVLTGWRAIPPAELRRHATVLRTTGLFGRIFGRDYRASRRLYLTLATGRIANREDMAAALQACADTIDAELLWCANPAVRRCAGELFQGLNTDWAIIAQVHSWSNEVRDAMPEADIASLAAVELLFSAPPDRLQRVRTFLADDGIPMRVAARETDDDLGTWATKQLAVLARLESAIVGMADVSLGASTSIADVVEVTARVRRIEGLDQRMASSTRAISVLGAHWHGVATTTQRIRAALKAADTVRDIRLSESALAWLFSGDFATRCLEAVRIATTVKSALRQEAMARDSARHAGIALGEVAPPEASVKQVIDVLAAAIAAPSESLGEWVKYVTSRAVCEAVPAVAAYVRALDHQTARVSALPERFEWCLLRTLGAETMMAHAAIGRGTWSGVQLDGMRQRIRQLQRELNELRRQSLAATAASVPIPRGRGSGPVASWTDGALLGNECAKKTRHVPIRELMRRAGDAVLTLTPCLMMSPLSVAQFLDDPGLQFDLVVIDEASQLRPEDALGALLRARQVVVVGDEQQLPPTEFFRKVNQDKDGTTEDNFEDETPTESVLDLALGRLASARVLQWHYRSRHHSLIEFSNQHFYDGKLVVAPAPRTAGPTLGVSIQRVQGVYEASTNELEADAVVTTVLGLVREHPNRSIGVVALNQPQADLLREKLEAKLADGAASYVERWKNTLESFFVKNLENVQGDERDIIVISMTFGPDPNGRVYQRFGPINGANGHRRLNVLFSRAKYQVVVVSSMGAEDIEIRPTSQRGVHALKEYLAHVRRPSTGAAPRLTQGSNRYARLTEEIERHGFDTETDVGTPRLTLEVGVRHGAAPGEFLAGLEVDAGGWVGPERAPDRDGTRMLVLENLGWNVVSTWTADWLREPGVARKRVAEALLALVRKRGLPVLPQRALVESATIDELPAMATAAARHEVPAITAELRAGVHVLGRFSVTGERVRVGRSYRCEIRVPDHYEEVSAVHVELVWSGTRFTVVDGGTRNGTYVDRQRVERLELHAGTTYGLRLGVGVVELWIVYGGVLDRTAAAGAAVPGPAGTPPATGGSSVPVAFDWLSADERQFLTLLRENTVLRMEDLVQQLGKSRVRVSGMARELRRKLHAGGLVMFRDEPMQDGETLYRYAESEVAVR